MMSSKDLERDFSGAYREVGNDLGSVRRAPSESGGMEQARRDVLPDTHGWGWLQK